ncbi:MAG: hypothetical protein GVY28_12385, partial [Alphaproteobacteria bacterium]|nr:hypothetical protein [Alphaproteobacteria bacterium]
MSPIPRRALGRTGWEVSALGLGCASYWARPGFPEAKARAVFETALECGITLFDTGASYAGGAAEQRLGRMLAASSVDTDRLFIATKAGTRTETGGTVTRDFTAPTVVRQVEDSLGRLGLERIALLQLHGPQPDELDDALLTALDRLRHDGKVSLIGVNAEAHALEPLPALRAFDVLMPFVSVLRPEGAALAARAGETGTGVLAAEPLARMRFAPPWGRWLAAPSGLWYLARALAERLRSAAVPTHRTRCIRRALDHPDWTAAQLALAWVLEQPGISSAVFGTTRPEHVRELAQAAGRRLPEPVRIQLDA